MHVRLSDSFVAWLTPISSTRLTVSSFFYYRYANLRYLVIAPPLAPLSGTLYSLIHHFRSKSKSLIEELSETAEDQFFVLGPRTWPEVSRFSLLRCPCDPSDGTADLSSNSLEASSSFYHFQCHERPLTRLPTLQYVILNLHRKLLSRYNNTVDL